MENTRLAIAETQYEETGLLKWIKLVYSAPVCNLLIQARLVIFGRYVLVFWTANTEIADKKTHFN